MCRKLTKAAEYCSIKIGNQRNEGQIAIWWCPPLRVLESVDTSIVFCKLILARISSRRDNDMTVAIRRIVDDAIV